MRGVVCCNNESVNSKRGSRNCRKAPGNNKMVASGEFPNSFRNSD